MAALSSAYASPSYSSFLSFSYVYPCFLRSAFVCSHRPFRARRQSLSNSHAAAGKDEQVEGVSQKRFPGRGKDEKAYLPPDGGRGDAGRSQSLSQSTVFKSIATQKRDTRAVYDLKDQQADSTRNLQDSDFLNAVVKVYCTHTAPDYSLPWQKQRQYTSTGSAFMIGDGKLLTNAHCVEHGTQVKVKRRGDDTKYVAKVLARGIECDIALLAVENEEFWKGAEPLHFGQLPCLQDAVTVVGYPLGGDTISVTKGVVSRIEVTSYAHGSSDLLGIQIDAAINPGNSGGPAFNDRELGIIRDGTYIRVQTVLETRVHLVPFHIEGGQPSYLIVAGLVFTPLSEPLIEEECEDSIGLKLLAKARYSLARFKGEEIVILSQVLANEVNIGYEDMGNQQVVKFNGTPIKNIRHLAHLVDSCKDKYLIFEFEDNFLAVLDREAASTAAPLILQAYGIPGERSSDLSEPYIDTEEVDGIPNQDIGDIPVSNYEIGFDGLLWA